MNIRLNIDYYIDETEKDGIVEEINKAIEYAREGNSRGLDFLNNVADDFSIIDSGREISKYDAFFNPELKNVEIEIKTSGYYEQMKNVDSILLDGVRYKRS